MKEQYLPIKGYEGFYEVSNLGNVRSVDRTITRRDGFKVNYMGSDLIPMINSFGNPIVMLSKNGYMKISTIAELVITSFGVEDFDPKYDSISYKDGNKANVRYDNLALSMHLSRAGGEVIVGNKAWKRPRKYRDIKRAGEALKFDYMKVLNSYVTGELKAKKGLKIQFSRPFIYEGKNVTKISL